MFTSWVKKKSLKKVTKSRFIVSGASLSPVMLMSMVGLLVVIGLFVVQRSLAQQREAPAPSTSTMAPR